GGPPSPAPPGPSARSARSGGGASPARRAARPPRAPTGCCRRPSPAPPPAAGRRGRGGACAAILRGGPRCRPSHAARSPPAGSGRARRARAAARPARPRRGSPRSGPRAGRARHLRSRAGARGAPCAGGSYRPLRGKSSDSIRAGFPLQIARGGFVTLCHASRSRIPWRTFPTASSSSCSRPAGRSSCSRVRAPWSSRTTRRSSPRCARSLPTRSGSSTAADARAMAKERDLYAILGLERTASADEIKKAYRRLARKHHPDVNPGDKQAEERFKEISVAHDVLTDPSKRKLYDEFGLEGLQAGFDPERAREYRRWADSGHGFSFRGGSPFEGFGFGGSEGRRRGRHEAEEERSFADIIEEMFGAGAAARATPRTARGADLEHPIEVDFLDALRG